MVRSVIPDASEVSKGEFIGYAKRDRTGDALYTVYEKDGFYHFYDQDGKNLHTHSVRMGLSTEGFSPCEQDGSFSTKERTREKVGRVLA